jgi:hypothetical protein
MSQSISSPLVIYHPEFNINTGKYLDCCPIIPRKPYVNYICYCNGSGKTFRNKTEYSYHIKLKSHQLYISNYHERINDMQVAKDYIINILQKNKKLENEIARLRFQLKEKFSESISIYEID